MFDTDEMKKMNDGNDTSGMGGTDNSGSSDQSGNIPSNPSGEDMDMEDEDMDES